MKTTLSTLALLLVCSLGYSQALKQPPVPVKDESYFRAGEWNVDLYGTGSLKNEQRDPNNLRLGAGFGATYFITKGFGLGLRTESESTAHSVFDLASGRVTYRTPLGTSFSPYGYIQGGFRFEQNRWEAGAGGGLEYRFNRYLGSFGEAGLVVDTDGRGLMRGAAGIRLSF